MRWARVAVWVLVRSATGSAMPIVMVDSVALWAILAQNRHGYREGLLLGRELHDFGTRALVLFLELNCCLLL